MKIKTNAKALLNAAKKTSAACGGKTIMADMIKFSCRDDAVLTAIGDPMTIITTVQDPLLEVMETGEFLIDSGILLSALKKYDGNIITLSTDKKGTSLSVEDDKSKMKLNIKEVSNFPNIVDNIETNIVKVEKNKLVNILKKSVYASGINAVKAIINGGHLIIEGGTIKIYCTDSYRLAVLEEEIDTGDVTIETTVPLATLKAIISLFEDEETIQIGYDEKRMMFSCENFKIISRLLDGSYPKVTNLIPADFSASSKATLERKRLLEAVDRCSIIKDDGSCVLLLSGKEGTDLTVSSKEQEIGFASDFVPCKWEGENLDISLDARFLKETMKAMDDEEITIEFYGNLRPFVIRKEQEVHLLLPIRTKN